MPDMELNELSKIYEQQGLDKDLAMQVALQLTKRNALEAHAREELGINEFTQPKPLQAALASALSFISGGVLPLLVSIFSPLKLMVVNQYTFSIIFLALSGVIAAKVGGSGVMKGVLRICFWGTVAMGVTALVGYLFGVNTA
jgi:VIT1/CCC1 family predicted Fe2+/Mn2+ transporter